MKTDYLLLEFRFEMFAHVIHTSFPPKIIYLIRTKRYN